MNKKEFRKEMIKIFVEYHRFLISEMCCSVGQKQSMIKELKDRVKMLDDFLDKI